MIFQCLNQRTYVISGFCGHLAATMWRNSLYKLLSSSNRYARSSLLSPSRSSSQVTEKGFEGSSVIQLYSSLSPRSPLSVDSSKLGFAPQKVSRIGISSSPAVIDVPLLARDAADAISHYGQCYWELSKARLSMLVVATSGAGYILGGGQAIDFAGLCWTCTGTMMVAASANSLNQVFEVNNDALMKRTSQRPLPSGRLSGAHAITFASSVGLAGTAILACKTNTLAAGLAASNLLLYAFVYTPLKQIHPVNTWVGAVVGAIPPLLGWAAASGEITLNGMVLPAALYFWQIPHFMALAYLCRNDYAAGGFKMFSLTDASGRRTALVALRNCLYLIPLGYVAYDWGLTSGWFCLESSLLTLGISTTALLFYRERTTKNAKRMFLASLLYLPVFMSGLVFHRLSDSWQNSLGNDLAEVIDPTLASRSGQVDGNEDNMEKQKRPGKGTRTRPPVAYASCAPFPFLPAPTYTMS